MHARLRLSGEMTYLNYFYDVGSSWYFIFFSLLILVVLFIRVFIKWYRFAPSRSYIQYHVIDQEITETAHDFRTCAVIGGTGFIGSHLVDGLLNNFSQSYRVIVLCRNIPPDKLKRHPGVAAYVQVDMKDYNGLVQAFANVDTVFHFGAVIPNAFVNSYEAVWRGNVDGATAVISACKTAGVKNLIYLGGFLQERFLERYVFTLSKSEVTRLILNAHEDKGLKTCVANVSIIFGQGDKFTQDFITGKATTFLNVQHEYYFMYVKTLIPLLVQLEGKLAAGDDRIAGKAIDLPGERMKSKEFFSLPEWNQRPTFVSVNVVKAVAYLNSLCAYLLNYAPLGIALCPQIVDELNASAKNDILPDKMLTIFGLKQVPSVREDIKTVVAEITKRN